jgi:hypothetical protein
MTCTSRGFLSATSVGFMPTKYAFVDDPERRWGIDFLEQELLEFSCVPVPANPEALIDAKAAGIDTAAVREWAEKILATDGLAVIARKKLEAIVGLPAKFRTLAHSLPDKAKGARGQLLRCANIAEREIAPAADEADASALQEEATEEAKQTGAETEQAGGRRDGRSRSRHAAPRHGPPAPRSHQGARRLTSSYPNPQGFPALAGRRQRRHPAGAHRTFKGNPNVPLNALREKQGAKTVDAMEALLAEGRAGQRRDLSETEDQAFKDLEADFARLEDAIEMEEQVEAHKAAAAKPLDLPGNQRPRRRTAPRRASATAS